MEGVDFVDGRANVVRNMQKFQPGFLCFNGEKAAKELLGVGYVDYGLRPESIESTRIFVAPSTSGMAAKYWDISYWKELAGLVRASRDTQT